MCEIVRNTVLHFHMALTAHFQSASPHPGSIVSPPQGNGGAKIGDWCQWCQDGELGMEAKASFFANESAQRGETHSYHRLGKK